MRSGRGAFHGHDPNAWGEAHEATRPTRQHRWTPRVRQVRIRGGSESTASASHSLILSHFTQPFERARAGSNSGTKESDESWS